MCAMNNLLIGFAFSGVLVAAAPAPAPAPAPSTGPAPRVCDLTVVDQCAASILFFAQNVTAVTDPGEVAAACRAEKIAIDCMENHNKKCLRGLAQGVSKLVIEGATQESELKCELNGPKNKDYYKYVPCINKNGVKVHKCLTESTRRIEAASRASSEERIPHLCCELHLLETCVATATKETCDAKHVAYVRSVIRGIGNNFFETVCSKYTANSKACKTLSPLKVHPNQKYLTIVPPIVELLQSF